MLRPFNLLNLVQAVRFSSFEAYKQYLDNDKLQHRFWWFDTGMLLGVSHHGAHLLVCIFHLTNLYRTARIFTAGLMAGTTEAIAVVTPMEVCKIRLQSQFHSMMDPGTAEIKYKNVFHAGELMNECVSKIDVRQ